jgi:hypothetical protein
MLKALLSRVSFLRQRAVMLAHRNEQMKAESDERRARWNQVIADQQKPLEKQTSTSSPPK